MEGDLGQQLHMETLLLLQFPTLLRKLDLLSVALIEDNLRVASNQHQHFLWPFSLLGIRARLQKNYLIRELVYRIDMKQLFHDELTIIYYDFSSSVFVLLQVEVFPRCELDPRVVAHGLISFIVSG